MKETNSLGWDRVRSNKRLRLKYAECSLVTFSLTADTSHSFYLLDEMSEIVLRVGLDEGQHSLAEDADDRVVRVSWPTTIL